MSHVEHLVEQDESHRDWWRIQSIERAANNNSVV
jgi:hypothetical protein